MDTSNMILQSIEFNYPASSDMIQLPTPLVQEDPNIRASMTRAERRERAKIRSAHIFAALKKNN